MKKIFYIFIASFLIFSITSCASMFSSKITNIQVKSTPENANVSLYSFSGGKIFEGKTPCIIAMNKKEVLDGKVVISLKGYKEVQVGLGRIIEPWGVANGCCFIIPGFIIGGGIDYLNGNILKPEVDNINIILEPVAGAGGKDVTGSASDSSRLVSINIQRQGKDFILFIR